MARKKYCINQRFIATSLELDRTRNSGGTQGSEKEPTLIRERGRGGLLGAAPPSRAMRTVPAAARRQLVT